MEDVKKTYIQIKEGDIEIGKEEVTEELNQDTIIRISKDIAVFNDRQQKLFEAGYIPQPKIKHLITN